MRRFASLVLTLCTILFALMATERAAYGYVDPGSGLLALQGFASALAAVGFYMRKRIASWFPSRKAAKPLPATATRKVA